MAYNSAVNYDGRSVLMVYVPTLDAAYSKLAKDFASQGNYGDNGPALWDAMDEGAFLVDPFQGLTDFTTAKVTGKAGAVLSKALGVSTDALSDSVIETFSYLTKGQPAPKSYLLKKLGLSTSAAAAKSTKAASKASTAKKKATDSSAKVIPPPPTADVSTSGGLSTPMIIGLGVAGLALIYLLTASPASPKAA